MLLRHARLLISIVGADAGANGRIHTVVGADAGANGRIHTVVGADAGANGRAHTSITESFLREFSQVGGEFATDTTDHGFALVGQNVLFIHE